MQCPIALSFICTYPLSSPYPPLILPLSSCLSSPYPLLILPLSAAFPQWTIWYPTLYCIFLWSYAGGSGIWVYPVLDWSKPLAPLSYLAAGALLFVAFGMT